MGVRSAAPAQPSVRRRKRTPARRRGCAPRWPPRGRRGRRCRRWAWPPCTAPPFRPATGSRCSCWSPASSANEATLTTDLHEHVRDGTTGLPGDDLRGYGTLLRRLIDARSHPHLHEVVEAGVFEDDDNPDYDFEFGLERLLDGGESLIRGRHHPPAAPEAPSA
ncbi:hypothetical protein ACIRPP_02960 [Streptomyces sp. NPDC101219]|uniref:hypothetical protein n=1 Tax=Streptomyces sp. NPDC101219 TaxID=3366131 RepID=UPI00381BA6E5